MKWIRPHWKANGRESKFRARASLSVKSDFRQPQSASRSLAGREVNLPTMVLNARLVNIVSKLFAVFRNRRPRRDPGSILGSAGKNPNNCHLQVLFAVLCATSTSNCNLNQIVDFGDSRVMIVEFPEVSIMRNGKMFPTLGTKSRSWAVANKPPCE
jgi:hypothetical protein